MIHLPTPSTLDQAAHLLRTGGLVAFPTETVYGLGANAQDDRAVASIYTAKGRPQFNPLIIHVDDAQKLDAFIVWNDAARKIAAAFWPGPLTLVLKRRADSPISLLASAGLDTLAVRIPSHPIARDLLARANVPVAAPSANASGTLSPTTAQHVAASLGDRIDFILDGGTTQVGVESTVLDLSTDRPTLLRPGGITLEQIESLLGPIAHATHDDTAPQSPGMLTSHYAPTLQVRLNATEATAEEAFLIFGDETLYKGGRTRLNLSPTGDLQEAAANLFAMLRALDDPAHHRIAVAPIPMTGLGLAINDRLTRAAADRTL